MNTLLMICVVAAAVGCSKTDEVKSAQKIADKMGPGSSEACSQNVIDAKIEEFMAEYLGVQFGDRIDKFTKDVTPKATDLKIPVKKQYKYFDKAVAKFENGKLYFVSFYAEIPSKFSKASVEEQHNKILSDLAVSFGCDKDFFDKGGSLKRSLYSSNGVGMSYQVWKMTGSATKYLPSGTETVRHIGVNFRNEKLRRECENERIQSENAVGERLPDAK